MRNPTIILNMGIGVWLLEVGAVARPSNITHTGHLLPEDHFAANYLIVGSRNHSENEERSPNGLDPKIAALIEVMTPAKDAVMNMVVSNKLNEIAEMDIMNIYVDQYGKYYPIVRPTLFESYMEYCRDLNTFFSRIRYAKGQPTTKDIARQLEWLQSDKTPEEVLKELRLNNNRILYSENLPKLQEFIEAYITKNSRKQTTLYHVMKNVIKKDILTSIIDTGLGKPSTKMKARQLYWMMIEKGPKQLFMELQSESMATYFHEHAIPHRDQANKLAKDTNLDDQHLNELNEFLQNWSMTDVIHFITTSIDDYVKAVQEYDWVKNNDAVNVFITENLYEAYRIYFKSAEMRDWIAYVNAYNTKPIDLNTIPPEPHLLDLSTFEESDVIKMVFLSEKLFCSHNELRWINDLQLQWNEKRINPTEVFQKLVDTKIPPISTDRFQVWLNYVKSYGATHEDSPPIEIVETLVNLVGVQDLITAIHGATPSTQIEILGQDLLMYKLKTPGPNEIKFETIELEEALNRNDFVEYSDKLRDLLSDGRN